MPTIKQSIENALEKMERLGCREGNGVYDDLKQALAQLVDGDGIGETLTQ